MWAKTISLRELDWNASSSAQHPVCWQVTRRNRHSASHTACMLTQVIFFDPLWNWACFKKSRLLGVLVWNANPSTAPVEKANNPCADRWWNLLARAFWLYKSILHSIFKAGCELIAFITRWKFWIAVVFASPWVRIAFILRTPFNMIRQAPSRDSSVITADEGFALWDWASSTDNIGLSISTKISKDEGSNPYSLRKESSSIARDRK